MLHIAKDADKLEMVAMNQVKYIHFTPGATQQGLGTEKLNSCTAVIVASPTGAILGHFSPRPENTPAEAAVGDTHIQAKMDQMLTLFKQHIQDFPKDRSTGLIAYTIYKGAVALPS
ncbi:MAG: hypothetical protein Q9210_000673 [Variospora velana]